MTLRRTAAHNANRALRDEILLRDAALLRVQALAVRNNLAKYGKLVDRLERLLRDRFGWIATRGFDASDYTIAALDRNLRVMRDQIRADQATIEKQLRSDLIDLGRSDQRWLLGAMEQSLQSAVTGVSVAKLSSYNIGAILDTKPFSGALFKEWSKTIGENAFKRTVRSIRTGMLARDSVDELIIRTFGKAVRTKAGWVRKGGAWEATTREAETFVRSAYASTSNLARSELLKANEDVLKGVQWVATLDDRTCFQTGTRIASANGWVPIESIVPGDRVLTHLGRFRKVLATRAKLFSGDMSNVTADGRNVSATSDHLFLGLGGWQSAGSLSRGDYVGASDFGPEKGDRLLRWLALEESGVHSDNPNSDRLEEGVLPSISSRRVPISAVDFESDVSDQKVDRVASNLRLRDVGDVEGVEAVGGVSFRHCWGPTPSVATNGAKSTPSEFGRNDSENFPARFAVDFDRRTAADFGAMPPDSTLVARSESLPASLANDSDRGFPSARLGTVVVPVGVAQRDGEFLSAGDANLRDSARTSGEVALSGTVGAYALADTTERFPAMSTDDPIRDDRAGVVAVSRTELSSGRSEQFNAADLAPSLFHLAIISSVESHSNQVAVVYDLEVEEDSSFIANGFVVHNCEICAPRDGYVYSIDTHEPLDGGPDWGAGPGAEHARCRCAQSPVTLSWKELGLNAPDLPPEFRQSMDGLVPSSETWRDWAARQPASRLVTALGKTRAAAVASGGLDIKELWNAKGELVSLKELDLTSRAKSAA